MEGLKLTKPTEDLKEEFFKMVEDYFKHGERLKPSALNIHLDDFKLMIKTLENNSIGIGLKENHVPHTTYWLVDGKKVLGGVNIRHELNEYLLKYDGHIGGAIRPSERNKGYATKMLALALEKAKTLGINKVLMTCNKGNIPSEKTIIKNGGVFESEAVEANGNIVRRFWISI